MTTETTNRFAYLRSALGTVVTGIFLMASGNAMAMSQVMGRFDQNPETIVQKVACLSIGFLTTCQHGSGDTPFKMQKHKKHQRKRERGGNNQRGLAQTNAAPTNDAEPVYESLDSVTSGSLIKF